MRALESGRGLRTGRLLVAAANALPIAGLVGFGWRPVQALFVCWVEIGVTLLGYYVVALFGQRESKPDQKTGGSYLGPVPLPLPDGSLGPVRSLPPLRYRNLRHVPATVPLVAIGWALSSRAFVEFPNIELVRSGRAAGSLLGYIAVAATPEGLALAAVTSAVHLFVLWRDVLARRLVEQYSASMLAELPVRIAVFWFVLTLLLAPAYVGTILLNTDSAVVDWGWFVVLLGVKLAVDAALLRVRYGPEPRRFTRLFVPNKRETDQPP